MPRPDPKRARGEPDGIAGESIETLLTTLSDASGGPPGRTRRQAGADQARGSRGTAGRRGAPGPAVEPAVRAGSKACSLPVETVIVDRRRRRDSSIEESLLEIYHAGLSVHQAEKIVGALWGARIGVSAVSALSRKIARRIDAWRNRPIRGSHVYVFLAGVELKRNWGSGCRSVGVLAAVGVTDRGAREVLGVVAGDREDQAEWVAFLRSLRERGLTGVKLFVGDLVPGLAAGIAALFPGAAYQQCVAQFYRSVLSLVPLAQTPAVEDLLETIHASADGAAARARAAQVESTMRLMNLPFVAVAIAEYVEATLSYYAFPRAHWHHLRSNQPLNRIMRDVRERARVVGAFSDGPTAVLLVCARLRHLADKSWLRRRLVMRHPGSLVDAGSRPGAA